MGSRVPVIIIAGAVVLSVAAGVYFMMRPAAVSAPVTTAPVATTDARPVPSTRGAAETPKRADAKKPAAVPKLSVTPTPAPAPVEAPATTASLHVVADVADASVFIDRKFVGTAPMTANDIAPGQHHLNVSAPGYDGYVEDLDVTAGPRELSIKFKEIKLAASISVIHKHAMGSCNGTLRATPQGLTYETANKDDGFSVSLTRIDTFEVDYLKKNLKVKLKSGKTYNFTDPDGNADHLFVFHRDVDKARQRMIAGGR